MPDLRILGRVEDIHGDMLAVGTIGAAVVIGDPSDPLGLSWELGPGSTDEFARLYNAACWHAGEQHGREGHDCRDELFTQARAGDSGG